MSPGATLPSVKKDWSKVGFGARLEHARVLRGYPSKNAVGAAIGMESGPTSRLFNDQRLVAKRAGTTINALARVLEVDAGWLTNGLGPEPHATGGSKLVEDAPQRAVDQEDRYPSRSLVLAAARAKGIDPAAIEAVANMKLKSDDDPGPEHWMAEVKKWVVLVKQLDDGDGDDFDDSQLVAAPPPVPKRRRA